MDYCVEIKGDVFDIPRRLREIDKGYCVFYNRKKHRFEVHNRLQGGGSFCLAVPYTRLDVRTLDLVRRTRQERAESFFAELEAENKRAEQTLVADAVKDAEKKTEEVLRKL